MSLKSLSIALLTMISIYSCESTFFQSSKTKNEIKQTITDKTWKINLVNLEKIDGDSNDFFF